MVSISACHAEDPGSIPGGGVWLLRSDTAQCDAFDARGAMVARSFVESHMQAKCKNKDKCTDMSTCSVAASYKPPMLVTRVRLPACAVLSVELLQLPSFGAACRRCEKG